MAELPQSRKSAEEIAQLRERMGAGAAVPAPLAQSKPDPTPEDASEVVPHVDDDTPIPAPQSKYVRTLRKSQAGWTYVATPPSERESWLPTQRRGVKSLEALRLHHVINLQPPEMLPHFVEQRAHRGMVALGYFMALAASGATIFTHIYPLAVLAIPVPVWIFLRRKFSRHHAAFMFTLAVLVLLFGILYFTTPHAA